MATYKVISGDSASQIAAKYGTTVAKLQAANPQFSQFVNNANYIQSGWVLNIPSTASSPAPAPTPAPAAANISQAWNLSAWQMGPGGWATQPVLTIGGQDFKFATPQEYADKMQSANLQGANASTFIGQFQNSVPYWKSVVTLPVTPTPPANSGQPSGTTAPSANVGSVSTNGVTVNLTKSITTAAFKSTDAYRALPQSVKDFVDIAYNLIEVGGEAEAKFFSNAVAQAQAVADPYYKTQLALAKAEVIGSIAEKNSDYELRSEVITRTRDELMSDVASSRDFLSLEQQADVARTIKSFDEDLLTIADQAAEKGLTFGTGARSRELAESRRSSQFADVVQSSSRKYNFQQKELELKAARGDVNAQKELAALRAGKGFALQGIGRAAEQVLGSANLPNIEGFTPVGGTTGKIEEEKRKAIVSDTAGYLNLQKGFI